MFNKIISTPVYDKDLLLETYTKMIDELIQKYLYTVGTEKADHLNLSILRSGIFSFNTLDNFCGVVGNNPRDLLEILRYIGNHNRDLLHIKSKWFFGVCLN